MQHQKLSKIHPKKQFSSWCLALWVPAPRPKLAPPKGHFWWYLWCFMHIEHSSKKRTVFLAVGGGGLAAHGASPYSNAACHAVQHARHQMPCASPPTTRTNFLGRGYTSPQPHQIQLVHITLTKQNKNMYYTFFLILQVHRTQIAQMHAKRPRNRETYNLDFLFPMFLKPSLLFLPNRIRYSWFCTGHQRWTRGDSSLWPRGAVTELPSGKSPGPPQNP